MNQIKAAAIYYVKRNIKLKDFIKRVLIVLQFPIVLIAFVYSKFSTKNRNLWLIGETGTDAKDNGSAFYSYLIDNHPEINTMYYISGETAAAARIHRMGKSVVTNSFQHKVAFMSAKYILSTHDGYSIPFVGANWHDFKAIYGWLTPRLQFVFLSHGVSKDDESGNANYQRTRFDYFVTSTEDEYEEFSSSRYGYPSGNVIKTGLSRYDVLLANSDGITQKRNIVFMPTWRYYLADVDDEEFTKSRYFKQIYSLLHDSDLNNLISDNQVAFYFFPPHHEIQKRMKLFDLDETKVVPIDTEASVFSDIVLS
ncbi:CDP-glycerol glycerophosphotransferase family protein, partial [Lactiplantibacillus pentosus]|uniref:CDP-glycerol glycerophosphotransferase family protein n=1 Tax=Lactiplantibacillus pentosus TaxID=1589 RepID=UPI0031E84797